MPVTAMLAERMDGWPAERTSARKRMLAASLVAKFGVHNLNGITITIMSMNLLLPVNVYLYGHMHLLVVLCQAEFAVTFQFVTQSPCGHAESPCGLGFIAITQFDVRDNRNSLDLVEAESGQFGSQSIVAHCDGRTNRLWFRTDAVKGIVSDSHADNVVRLDPMTTRHDARAVDDISQLTDVSRPIILEQLFLGSR